MRWPVENRRGTSGCLRHSAVMIVSLSSRKVGGIEANARLDAVPVHHSGTK
jgi:hypothetical protein